MSRERLDVACDRLNFARRYTRQFLTELTDDQWFWTPPGLVTHIAWQVAHVASSQYSLCLLRVRGRQAEDEAVIPQTFFEGFRIGSTPKAGAENNPPLSEIQRVFDAVHHRVLEELAGLSDQDLDVPVEHPHPAFSTKLGAVEYCPLHEMVHAGQIALLRRQMGMMYKR
jgi:hypothetical protein